jgi:hypothetical protein
MDLRAYYRKLRSIEAELREDSVVIISRETTDGGRAGVKSDVPRALGARLMVDEKADLATPEEAAEFRAEVEGKWKGGHGAPAWVVNEALPDGRGSVTSTPLPDGRGSVTNALLADGRGSVAEIDGATANEMDEKS